MIEKNLISRIKKRTYLILITPILVIIFFYIMLLPVSKNNSNTTINIKAGTTYNQAVSLLKQNNLIKSELATKIAGKMFNLSNIKEGNYQISKANSAISNLKIINGQIINNDNNFVIREGETIKEIADNLSKRINFSKKEILDYWDNRNVIKVLENDYKSLNHETLKNKDLIHPLEGYIFPSTYKVYKEDTLENITKMFLNETEKNYEKYQKELNNLKISYHEALSLASIIEKESNESFSKTDNKQRKDISSVFWNRMKKNMALQSDTTVNYIINDSKINIKESEMYKDSPYSTYTKKGLPVGPIASPSSNSLEAALKPNKTKYLYFYASPPPKNEVFFTTDYDEHLKIKEKYPWDKNE